MKRINKTIEYYQCEECGQEYCHEYMALRCEKKCKQIKCLHNDCYYSMVDNTLIKYCVNCHLQISIAFIEDLDQKGLDKIFKLVKKLGRVK